MLSPEKLGSACAKPKTQRWSLRKAKGAKRETCAELWSVRQRTSIVPSAPALRRLAGLKQYTYIIGHRASRIRPIVASPPQSGIYSFRSSTGFSIIFITLCAPPYTVHPGMSDGDAVRPWTEVARVRVCLESPRERRSAPAARVASRVAPHGAVSICRVPQSPLVSSQPTRMRPHACPAASSRAHQP